MSSNRSNAIEALLFLEATDEGLFFFQALQQVLPLSTAWAQLISDDTNVTMGHSHLLVKDIRR